MSRDLINILRKSRQFRVTVGAFTFVARRPTDVEMGGILRWKRRAPEGTASTEGEPGIEWDLMPDCVIAERFVVGWDPVPQDAIVRDGCMDTVTFDPELWREWCAERADFWAPIARAVIDAYNEHAKHTVDIAKN